MQLDQLQIELRPRSPAQALDLGFALLRTCPYASYMAFAALMLPLALLCAGLIMAAPAYALLWILLPRWFRPAIERSTLYVLSRQVFGTRVRWQDAVRAWPRQLKGGSWQMLTWWRPLAAGRSLIQPIWQLENARGAVAGERRRILCAQQTGRSAFWFGLVCALFEAVLFIGFLHFFHELLAPASEDYPLTWLFAGLRDGDLAAQLASLGFSVAAFILVGPVYTACGFALYLNRRAALEAWDIEIQLRQIVRPASSRRSGTVPVLIGAVAIALSLASPPEAMAAKTLEECMQEQSVPRLHAYGPEQERVRRQLDTVYAAPDLSRFRCEQRRRIVFDQTETDPDLPKRDMSWLATILKVIFIAGGIGALAWLLYRYRSFLPVLRRRAPAMATEVGGLDIRAESLPPAVTDEVLRHWRCGERRAALALLYRATLSRLATEDRVPLYQGDTEGDCLRHARQARAAGTLAQGRFDVARATTEMWLGAAYGDRWPQDAQVQACCSEWELHFPATGTTS